MAKRDEAFLYRNILAIDPGYSFSNGTGYAIFDHKTHKLKSCGLIRPFAPGLESHSSVIEMADKVKRKWEEEVGFSYDPKVLCIEHPQACFIKNGVMVNSNSIIMLAVLGARIEERFKPETLLRPHPSEWKKRLNKDQTKNWVLETLEPWSLKALEKGLESVTPHRQHNVFDAIGIGLWSIDKIKNKLLGTIYEV
jgi:hypothetical protein